VNNFNGKMNIYLTHDYSVAEPVNLLELRHLGTKLKLNARSQSRF
jgi:hypothetical protein